jgi:O-methyltransferase domain/Dimerisation domain
MNAPPMPARRLLAQMLVGNQIQQAIHVAAELGIADLLKDGSKRSQELAQATGAHQGSLYRLLRALASFGVFAEDEEGRFELTPVASLLQTGTPGSMRAFALWSGGVSYQVFGDLEYSVLSGKPAFEHIFGMEFYEYLAHNPDVGALFDELMSWNTSPVAPVVAAYDFSGVNTIVDVGGGRGDLLASILSAHPTMRGVLVDQPRATESAKGVLEAAGVADRCATVCGNVSKSVPRGGDAYLLKSVVHGLDDDQAAHLLSNCYHAMNDGAKLLVIEFVMPTGNDPFPGKLMDLLMLVGCHGRERTEEEFRSLFAAAGFRLTNIVTTKFGYSVIEGRPA